MHAHFARRLHGLVGRSSSLRKTRFRTLQADVIFPDLRIRHGNAGAWSLGIYQDWWQHGNHRTALQPRQLPHVRHLAADEQWICRDHPSPSAMGHELSALQLYEPPSRAAYGETPAPRPSLARP